MPPVPATTPPQLPVWVEVALWALLAGWLLYLGFAGRGLGSAGLAMSLCLASFPLTAAVVLATEAWPQPQAGSFIRLIAWMSFALGLSGVVMWLHHRSDDNDPGDHEELDPEPPWWPEFEREFRDYARGPRRGPRQPIA